MTDAGRLRAVAHVLLALLVCCATSVAQPVKKLIATEALPPKLELSDLQGKSHRLADYKGKVVLVNFWATWCEPCRDEMPSMRALYRRLGAPGGGDLVVLAVNHGENAPRIEQFLRGSNDEWTLRTAEGLEALLKLTSIEVTLELSEVFAGVDFAPAPIRTPVPPSKLSRP